MSSRADDCKKLNALLDAASDAVMETSDADILAEAKLRHEDPSARLAQLRKMASDRISVTKRQRLANARAAIDAAAEATSRATTPLVAAQRSAAQMRVRIGELLQQFAPQDTRLTLAFRNGEDMSDDDTASLLEDLEALARLQGKDR
jgi:hypothetical protein